MSHPFQKLSDAVRLRWFWALLLLVPLFPLVMAGPLITEGTPGGIVDLQLATTVPEAERVISAWDERTRLFAAFTLGLDYLFMVVYSNAVALACVAVAERWRGIRPALVSAGLLLAWAQWGAVAFDMIENYASLMMLLGPVREPWPLLTTATALPKFGLLGLGVLYALGGWVALRVHE